jgi:two-component system response regulator LytT
MIQIALVDDDQAASNELQDKLQKFASENGEQFSISTYHEAVSFLDHYQSVDIVFMDVEMPYLNGIAAAQKLRQIDEKVALIYVTNYMQYAVEGYEVNALGYLLKPINYARLSSVLKKTLNLLLQEAKGLLVKTSSGLKKVYPDELMYIEISGHLIEIHTKNGVLETWGSLKELEKKLPEGRFARPNSNTMVNLSFVKGFEGDDLVLSEGSRLPISRRKKKEFIDFFRAYNNQS